MTNFNLQLIVFYRKKEFFMKIARLINAVLFLITLIFYVISFFNNEVIIRIMATTSLGIIKENQVEK